MILDYTVFCACVSVCESICAQTSFISRVRDILSYLLGNFALIFKMPLFSEPKCTTNY